MLHFRPVQFSRLRFERVLALLSMLITTGAFAQDLSDMAEDLPRPWFLQQRTEARREDEDSIETDRDSFTPATTTVATGRLIYESSYSFIENRGTANTNSFPEMISRIGLTDRLELRVGWNYEVGGGGVVSNGDAGGDEEEPGKHRDSQALFGFKYSLSKQRGLIPQSAFIVQGTVPTTGPQSTLDSQFCYVAGWKLFDKMQLDSSIRYSTTEEKGDHYNLWAPSVVLKVPLTDRWNVHGEYFGIFTDGRTTGRNQQYLTPGVHYLITPNLEVGVRLGWGLNLESANFFSNVGFGYRF